jgi:glycosyltransferase involved in cell wall biosynthesis
MTASPGAAMFERLRRHIVELGPLPPDPLVSVLITNYNYADAIGAAIESVVQQTYKNLELVICDDGSTDDSLSVIQKYAQREPRIRWLSRPNGGQAAALKAAFAESSGAVICILDSDDEFAATKIAKVVDAFRSNPECGAVIHYMRIVKDGGGYVGPLIVNAEGYIGDAFLGLSVANPYPPSSGICMRREVAAHALPADLYADFGISGVCALLTRSYVIREELSDWRVHDDSHSGGAAVALSRLDEPWLKKHLATTERGLRVVVDWARETLGLRLDYSTSRQYIEYRLALGLVTSDRKLVREASADLRRAFRTARMGYPSHRYWFWVVLSSLPMYAARTAMQFGFWLYYRLRRRAG